MTNPKLKKQIREEVFKEINEWLRDNRLMIVPIPPKYEIKDIEIERWRLKIK